MNKHIKISMLIVCSLCMIFLLTDYNFMKSTIVSDIMLIAISMCWIKSYELVHSSD